MSIPIPNNKLNLARYVGLLFSDGTLQTTSASNIPLSSFSGAITENQLPSAIDSAGSLTMVDLGVF